MDQFKIEALQGPKEGWRILKLSGAFTLNAIFEFQLATRTNPEPVTIVDLTDVPYMDSAALGSLLGFHASCHRENRRYALAGVPRL